MKWSIRRGRCTGIGSPPSQLCGRLTATPAAHQGDRNACRTGKESIVTRYFGDERVERARRVLEVRAGQRVQANVQRIVDLGRVTSDSERIDGC